MEPIKTEKMYTLIMKQLNEMISEQNLKPGDKLPSERELSATLSVSRSSVRQAIAAMVAKGILVSQQGDGTYIAKGNESNNTFEEFGRYLAKEQISPNDIIEVRMLIECESARLCALRSDEKLCNKLQNLLERHRIANGCASSLEDMNKDLHSAIAEGSGNRALMCLQDEIWELMDGNMWQYLKSSTNKRLETVRLHLDQHEEIVRAICLHNPDQAKEAMRNHLQNIDENMEDLLSSYQDTPRDKH